MALPILALIIFSIHIDFSLGSCGTCQSNNVACQSLTTFSICIDNIPRTETITPCPDGTVCTNQSTICVENSKSSFVASCGRGCDVCDSHDKVFSCVGTTLVAFCFGESQPYYESYAKCPEGYVCDLSSRKFCVKKDESMASCDRHFNSSISTTTTIMPDVEDTSSIRDATTFCRENSMEGTFPAEGDETCKKYYICKAVSTGAGFMGYSYTCSGNDYFDPVRRYCTRERPDSCEIIF